MGPADTLDNELGMMHCIYLEPYNRVCAVARVLELGILFNTGSRLEARAVGLAAISFDIGSRRGC